VDAGDVIKVARAGIIYVVGEVKKPGGFTLKTNENITVLQALALAEGILKTAAKGRARIIRTDSLSGARREIPLDIGKILAGKAQDPELASRDILFVPGSGAKTALYKSGEAALQIVSGVIIWRR
jgi:polysaccharide export outer membrane protein